VMRSNMLRGSRMKVGSTTRLRSAPGLNWDMMWDRTTRGQRQFLLRSCTGAVLLLTDHFPDRARPRACHLRGYRSHRLRIDCLDINHEVVSMHQDSFWQSIRVLPRVLCWRTSTGPLPENIGCSKWGQQGAESCATHWHSRSPGGGQTQVPSSFSLLFSVTCSRQTALLLPLPSCRNC
jgi:hypothetical protein